jgi:hypothetical protein
MKFWNQLFTKNWVGRDKYAVTRTWSQNWVCYGNLKSKRVLNEITFLSERDMFQNVQQILAEQQL